MKKLIFLMCIGGMMAFCTPLPASEKAVDPPNTRHITRHHKKTVESRAETPASEESKPASQNDSQGNSGAEPAHTGGGVIVISGTALLLIIILLILLC